MGAQDAAATRAISGTLQRQRSSCTAVQSCNRRLCNSGLRAEREESRRHEAGSAMGRWAWLRAHLKQQQVYFKFKLAFAAMGPP